MAVTSDYLVYVVEQLAQLERVATRRMFGGVGLYAREVFFGLIDDDTLYFKVDDTNRADYVARGGEPFRPFADWTSTSYFSVPADVLEDAEELCRWARKALQVAAADAAAKSRRGTARHPAKRLRR